jgi:hypothetical protein
MSLGTRYAFRSGLRGRQPYVIRAGLRGFGDSPALGPYCPPAACPPLAGGCPPAVPQVYVNGKWVAVGNFLDQALTMTTSATVYTLPDAGSGPLAVVPSGQPIGTVYSYIQNAQGFWWQVIRDNGQYGYVLFVPASTVTPPQPAPPVSHNPFGLPDLTSFWSGLGTAGKWAVGGAAAVALIVLLRK